MRKTITTTCFLLALGAAAPARAQAPGAAPAGEPPAAPVAAAPAPRRPATSVMHVPPGQAEPDKPLRLVAVIDLASAEATIVARYRPLGSSGKFDDATFERSSAGGYFATVPAERVTRPGLEYYIAGRNPSGGEVPHFASAASPYQVRVEPGDIERLAEVDAARIQDRRDTVRVDVLGHDFGNRYGHKDYYLRGEAQWTHQFLRHLYAISFGYGAIRGRTPDSDLPDAKSVRKDARYGFSEVRLRLHPSIFLDGRAILGVSRTDLEYGASGVLTLGRPWRASVQIGGEAMRTLGPSVFVRLQWDTAPPFLMGASVVKTDLPDAVLADGLYVRYDLTYPIAPAFSVSASVSYGSRDGASHWGGGAGTAVSF